MIALKGMMQQQQQQQAMMPGQLQAQQQQIQASQQENQARAQQLKDQQAMTQAMQDWDGKDMNALPGLMLKRGASAQAVMSTKAGLIKQQQDLANLSKDQLAVEKTKNDYFVQALDNVKSLPPDQQPAGFQSAVQDAVQKGHLDPQTAQGLQYQGPQQLDLLEKTLTGHAGVLDQALKQADTREKTAQAAKLEQETNYTAGPAAEGRYRFVLSKLVAKQPVSADDLNFAKAYEASNAKTTATSDSLGITSTNTSRPSGLATVGGRAAAPQGSAAGGTAPAGGSSPKSTRESTVDLIGQYKTDPQTVSRLLIKHPDLLGLVHQKYPDWDQTTYNAKNKLMTGFTSGQQSKEINAINTAMGHVKALDDAVDALHNGNVTLLNRIGTAYNINVGGKTPEAAFKLIVNRVGPEIASAYIPGGGGEHERIANQEDFNVNLPPQTLHNNAAVTVELLRSKIGALENQYKNTVQRDDFAQRFITPQAQASLQKFAGKGNSGGLTVGQKVKLKNGNTVTVKAVHADGTFDAE